MSVNAWSSTSYPIISPAAAIPSSQIVYSPLTLPITVQETTKDGQRWYTLDGQYYPSITTLLTATDTEGAAALAKWRQSVGHARAAEVTTRAAQRGVQWHTFCEQFVMGETPHWSLLSNPTDVAYAASVATVLNRQIAMVFASETRIASSTYGVAGRMDLAVLLRDGRRAILDFKTGKKLKSGNRLNNYAMQATFYADALTEHVPSRIIDTIVIAQLLPDRIVWQESSPALWRDALKTRITEYATLLNERLG